MIIGDFNVIGIAAAEAKTDAPLVIHPDRVLTGTITLQLFQSVRRRQSQIVQPCGRVQLTKPHDGPSQDFSRQPATASAGVKPLGFVVGKRSDHTGYINNMFMEGKRAVA
jgi:hypothetical protein